MTGSNSQFPEIRLLNRIVAGVQEFLGKVAQFLIHRAILSFSTRQAGNGLGRRMKTSAGVRLRRRGGLLTHHIRSMMISFKNGVMPKYAPRFDYDGWMVVNTAVHDGEMVDEPLRRGLSFAEAERSAAFFNRRRVRHPAHRNCRSELPMRIE